MSEECPEGFEGCLQHLGNPLCGAAGDGVARVNGAGIGRAVCEHVVERVLVFAQPLTGSFRCMGLDDLCGQSEHVLSQSGRKAF